MANHGAGNKFVSVNLNKSYGKFSNSASSYGSRVRSGGQIGGGGGMVVLSRPRSSQKTGQKLSVPSPVNLPSMRKEYEKFDSSGAGGGSAGGAAGTSSRPSSAGMGWTKPAVIVMQENSTETLLDVGGTMSSVESASKLGSVYMPPSKSGSSADVTSSSQLRAYSVVEKVAILRGEDFPSLHTSLTSGTGNTHKQKEGANQKSKQLPAGDLSSYHMNTANIGSVDMHPQGHTSQQNMGGSSGNEVGGPQLSGPRSAEESRKQESYNCGSFPEFRLNQRSDWADDERDTGQVFTDRSRNHGSLNNEGYWGRDFEIPRGSFFPPKPAPNVFNKWGQRDRETGKVLSSEVFKADSYSRDARPTSIEGRDRNSWNTSESHGEGRDTSSWRSPATSSIRAKPQEHMNNTSAFGAESFNMKREMTNESRFVAPPSLDRKNPSSFEGGRYQWNNNAEPPALQGSDRHRNNSFQNVSSVKPTFSLSGKGSHVNDPLLNFSKVKKPLTNTDDLPLDDPFNANGYDGRDPFSGGLVGVVKRKKDLPILTEVNDPARESFEAELERVQKMQEQERKRAIEEQERAMHLARLEEEERLRQAREHEQMKRRLEEEAREAAWRVEQEHLQSIQKAEEQRIAREEEKQRMQMEEERRKQAAKQKLLELEEKIARRKAEAMRDGAACSVDGSSEPGKEKETSRAADISDWEDGERMVERITTSASSDSSGLNRFVDPGSGHHSFADNSALPGRGKSFNSQRRDAYENECSSNLTWHNQESSSIMDSPFHPKKSIAKKDLYEGSGFHPHNYTNAGVLVPDVNDPFQTRGQKWSFPDDSNPEIDAEIHDRFTEKLGDAGRGGSSSPHSTRSLYQERPYQNHELGEVYSYSRSRYSMRQPRVLPPPPISSMNRTLNRGETERSASSTSLDRDRDSNYARDSGMQTGYDDIQQESLENPEMVAFHTGLGATRDQLPDGTNSIRCDSQSSLSVTSPPSSPAYLSHEDLEDSRGTPGSSADADDKDVRSSKADPAIRNHSFLAADDVEWMSENRENLQQQEVYDEGGEYQEGDEVGAEDAADIDLNEEFGTLNLLGKNSSCASDNLILGFNEGIEVGMPSDESESNRDQNSKISTHLSNSHANSLQSDGHVVAQSTQMQKTEEQNCDLAVHSNVDAQGSAMLTEAAASSGKSLPAVAADPVSQSVTSSMPTGPKHPEAPIKLQFGLFSGPSLIPSPVPCIQIGSIQMPLHLNPPVGSSLPHQSGPQFHLGQLRYNTPTSQGMLPLVPQAISFVQPIVTGQSANSNPAGPMSVQPVQQYSHSQNVVRGDALVNNHESFSINNLNSAGGPSSSNYMKTDKRHGSDVKFEDQSPHGSTPTDPLSSTDEGQVQSRVIPHQFSKEREMIRSKSPVPVSGGRARGNFSSSRNIGIRTSNNASMVKFQRNGQQGGNQLHINSDRRFPGKNDKVNFGPRGARISSRNGPRRSVYPEKMVNQNSESNLPVSSIASTNDVTSGSKDNKGSGNSISIAGHDTTQAGEVRHKRNIEDDIDVTLQSGIVGVYDQPGIQVPSDEDDFIEVRSKRQMLIDRREQREKDNKDKFRVTKNLQKPKFTSQTRAPRNSNKMTSSFGRGSPHEAQSSSAATESRIKVKAETSVVVDSISVSLPLAPIGTPSTHTDVFFDKRSQSVKSGQAGRLSAVSTGEVGPGSITENNSKASEKVDASLGPWNNVWVNQQVMHLTQSQQDDPMNPARLDAHGSYSEKTSGTVGVLLSSSSSLVNDKSFSTTASPVNSLLAGKKIQFGAVTSPSILPSCCRAVSQGVGTSRSDQVSHEFSASDNVHSLFNAPEKQPKESSTHIDISETEVKLSASAAVGGTNDILGSNTLRSNVSDSEGFKQATDDGIYNDQKSSSRSRSEESLSVSLPADLSIEMSPISVWQPLPSPQNAPHLMLSHFPGGHPSHVPFYEMNPLVGGPVFAVGPSDDASGSQAQSQNNKATVSGSPGPWQQHHPGPDAFYGLPAGFPLISQPGGIQGAQGPPHMVVYNHFAPVGQYGQVGLSFMGTTYVPSGKQPDWKHNPTSSAMPVGDDNTNNMGINSGQHIPHNVPTPVAMLDVSPYQPQLSSDMPGSARWSHIPPQHLYSMPQMLPHPERLMHSQLSNGTSLPDNSTAPTTLINSFPDSHIASANNYPVGSSDAPASELGLVESSGAASIDPPVSKMSDTNVDAGKIGSSRSGGGSQSNVSMKSRPHQQKQVSFQHRSHSTGFNHHKGAESSQKNSSGGGEWPNRRAGYHSRNHSSSGKVKQIYVAKQPAANVTAAAPGTS